MSAATRVQLQLESNLKKKERWGVKATCVRPRGTVCCGAPLFLKYKKKNRRNPQSEGTTQLIRQCSRSLFPWWELGMRFESSRGHTAVAGVLVRGHRRICSSEAFPTHAGVKLLLWAKGHFAEHTIRYSVLSSLTVQPLSASREPPGPHTITHALDS